MIEFNVVCSATCEKESGGDVVGYCGDGTNAAAITDAPMEEAMLSTWRRPPAPGGTWCRRHRHRHCSGFGNNCWLQCNAPAKLQSTLLQRFTTRTKKHAAKLSATTTALQNELMHCV